MSKGNSAVWRSDQCQLCTRNQFTVAHKGLVWWWKEEENQIGLAWSQDTCSWFLFDKVSSVAVSISAWSSWTCLTTIQDNNASSTVLSEQTVTLYNGLQNVLYINVLKNFHWQCPFVEVKLNNTCQTDIKRLYLAFYDILSNEIPHESSHEIRYFNNCQSADNINQ